MEYARKYVLGDCSIRAYNLLTRGKCTFSVALLYIEK